MAMRGVYSIDMYMIPIPGFRPPNDVAPYEEGSRLGGNRNRESSSKRAQPAAQQAARPSAPSGELGHHHGVPFAIVRTHMRRREATVVQLNHEPFERLKCL